LVGGWGGRKGEEILVLQKSPCPLGGRDDQKAENEKKRGKNQKEKKRGTSWVMF